jgi:urease accessory protein
MRTEALLRLMTWLSPAYPVGAFSYSHGIEWAVEAGDVRDPKTLTAWIEDVLGLGGGWSDAVLFAHTWRAVAERDRAALAEIAELAAAYAPSRERRLETTAQGAAFLTATRAAWPAEGMEDLMASLPERSAYPVAVAVAAASHGIALPSALPAYLLSLAANLVSAGVRLIPLGQTHGQQAIAALEPTVATLAEAAMAAGLDDLGGAVIRADIAAMRHETQHTRLFRT